MTSNWRTLLPDRLGDLPLGGDLLRTDAAGPPGALIAFLGVHPGATAWKNPVVKRRARKVPAAVERTSLDPASPSGRDFGALYLEPLGLRREDVLLVDLWPYYLASTRRESGRASTAENIAVYEKATSHKTAVEARPVADALLRQARTAPGNVERLAAILGEAPRRLVVTLGNEPAAFVRGLDRAVAAQEYLYTEPAELDVAELGLRSSFVHLAHPGNGKPEWREKHAAWCAARGGEIIRAALASPSTDAGG